MYQYNALVTHNTYFIYLNNLHCCDICYYTTHYFWNKHIAYQYNAVVTQNTYFIYFFFYLCCALVELFLIEVELFLVEVELFGRG